jgi:ATP-dependent DNA ligase
MECLPVAKLPATPQWILSLNRWVSCNCGQVRAHGSPVLARRKSFNRQFLYILEALHGLPEGTVIDGEMVALDDAGRPNFNLSQPFRSEGPHIRYFVFDLLICKDRDLTALPLSQRGELLKGHLPGSSLRAKRSTRRPQDWQLVQAPLSRA